MHDAVKYEQKCQTRLLWAVIAGWPFTLMAELHSICCYILLKILTYHFEKYYVIIEKYIATLKQARKSMSNGVISTVFADGLAPNGARPSASAMMTN